jgi:hypothetical protein
LQATSPCAVAGAVAAGVSDAVAAFDFSDALAFFSTPPCPLQAPLPAFEVEPSLQVTLSASGAAAAKAADASLAWDAAFLSTPP